jgi:hypothetical protein
VVNRLVDLDEGHELLARAQAQQAELESRLEIA